MKQILFSCVGSTDPVRGGHDGGLMHIMRKYRPEAVFMFMTPEMVKQDANDSRYDKMLSLMKERWDGYAPKVIRITPEIRDASDLDELSEPLESALAEASQAYPEHEILVNITSGTPQMQMTLSHLALDMRYRTKGVQVKNFEKKAGTTERTNSKTYDVDFELELAEEEESEAGAPNRCIEPQLFALRRHAQWQQVEALLKRRDYGAILKMPNSLPPRLMQLVAHLDARNQLQDQEAKRSMRGLDLGFELYPIKKGVAVDSTYHQVSEYFLMMKNFQITGRYTDFVLRLNPFIIRLQAKAIDMRLRKEHNMRIADILIERRGHSVLSEQKLRKALPELAQRIEQDMYANGMGGLVDKEPSMYIYNIMLSQLGGTDEDIMKLFRDCEWLNRSRNSAAHELFNLTEAGIQEAIGESSAQLVRRIERAIAQLYAECCDPALFRIYEKCNEYIREHR